MEKKIYVGNLAFTSTEDSISDLFSQYGAVNSCRLITDRDTGRSKGFGFVEMSSHEEAATAISSLDGKDLDGRALKVMEARPKPERSSGGMDSDRGGFTPRSDRGEYGSSGGGRRSSY